MKIKIPCSNWTIMEQIIDAIYDLGVEDLRYGIGGQVVVDGIDESMLNSIEHAVACIDSSINVVIDGDPSPDGVSVKIRAS